jgi:hypothetical protein
MPSGLDPGSLGAGVRAGAVLPDRDHDLGVGIGEGLDRPAALGVADQQRHDPVPDAVVFVGPVQVEDLRVEDEEVVGLEGLRRPDRVRGVVRGANVGLLEGGDVIERAGAFGGAGEEEEGERDR